MKPEAPDPLLRRLLALGGFLIAALGSVVLWARFTAHPGWASLVPDGKPMSFTTAVIALLAGAAFVLHGLQRTIPGRLLGGLLVALGLGTLFFQQTLAWLNPAAMADNPSPTGLGRIGVIAPSTAICFMLLGALLALMGAERARFALKSVLASLLVSVAFLSLCSYLIGLQAVAGWWRHLSMAVPTSGMFVFAGVLLLCWIIRHSGTGEKPVAQSLPFFALALGLITVVGFVSRLSNLQLAVSSDRLVQTYRFIGSIDRLVSEVARMESSSRGYALTGQDSFYGRVYDHLAEINAMLGQLDALAAGSPPLTEQVVKLHELVAGKRHFTIQLLWARDEEGQEYAMKLLAGQSDTTGSALVRLAEEMRRKEIDHLGARQAEMRLMEKGARKVQLGAGALALILVLLAFGLEHRASLARARAEAGLQAANQSLELRVRERTAELQQALDQVVDRERSMRFWADAMPQLVWALLPDGSTTAFNQSWYDYTGLTEAESRRSWWEKSIHPLDLEETWRVWGRIRRSGQEGGGELRLRRARDGEFRWMLWRARPEYNAEEVLLRWVGTMTDIHDQKAAAELLEERVTQRTNELARVSRLQRGVLDGTVFGIIATDAQGLITEFNKGAEQMLGYRREEMVGRQTPVVLHDPVVLAARAAELSRSLGRTIESGFTALVAGVRPGMLVQSETHYVAKDGRRIAVALSVTALRDQDGAITGYLGLAEDLSERKEAEAALRTSERRLREAQQIARMGNWEFAPEAREQEWWSDELYRIFGLEPGGPPITNELFYQLVHPEDRAGLRAAVAETLATKGRYRREYRIRRADGEERHLNDEAQCVCDADGRVLRMQGVIQDITELKQLLDHLEQVRDQALEASRLKSEFLANISHELRTPMNGIIGMSGILMETPLSAGQAEMGRVIQRSAENLLTIINDILDFSKMEAGKMRMETGEFELRELIEETLAMLAPKAREKKLELSGDYGIAGSATLQGDAGRIRQVLTNLLGNAVKFTESGEVVVTVRPMQEEEGHLAFRIEVRDTGIGVPESQQGRLFQAFSQVDGTHTRRFSGTGLGLAISRQIIELMGGTIGFTSAPGQGSNFWFELDLPLVARTPGLALATPPPDHRGLAVPPAEIGADAPPSGRRLLVAEDNEANQIVIRHMLARLGHAVVIVPDGQAALEALAQERYDAVLMDCQMPRLDGYEATRRLRAGAVPGLPEKLPIIALTAYAMPADRERCLAAGMSDYLTKPVRLGRLREVLQQFGLGTAEAIPVDAHRAPSPAPDPDEFDLAQLEEMRGLPGREHPTLLQDLIAIVLAEVPEALTQMQTLLDQREHQPLARLVHRLAGSFGNVGGKGLREQALQLERLVKQTEWGQVPARLADLGQAWTRLEKQLRTVRLEMEQEQSAGAPR